MTFTAKYDGRCGECGEEIAEGDLLEWVDTARGRKAVHADECADRVEGKNEQGANQRPTCPSCWQVIAHNGSCGCDDS